MAEKKKVKSSFKDKAKSFFNSSQILIITLILIIGILIWFSYHLMSISKVYMFSGKSDHITILNGVISLNYDINVIEGSHIEYTHEKDYKVNKYKMGYYVGEENNLKELVIKSGEDEVGLSLKGIINEMSAFNITEPYHNDIYFTKEKIKILDKGLYFIVEAITSDGEEIYEKINMNLYKVSR